MFVSPESAEKEHAVCGRAGERRSGRGKKGHCVKKVADKLTAKAKNNTVVGTPHTGIRRQRSDLIPLIVFGTKKNLEKKNVPKENNREAVRRAVRLPICPVPGCFAAVPLDPCAVEVLLMNARNQDKQTNRAKRNSFGNLFSIKIRLLFLYNKLRKIRKQIPPLFRKMPTESRPKQQSMQGKGGALNLAGGAAPLTDGVVVLRHREQAHHHGKGRPRTGPIHGLLAIGRCRFVFRPPSACGGAPGPLGGPVRDGVPDGRPLRHEGELRVA